MKYLMHYCRLAAIFGKVWTCYRVGTVVNTNIHIEAFHRLLKVVYFEGKQNRRLEHLLSIIFKVARDKGYERLQKQHKGKVTHRSSEINSMHKNAEEMISNGINPIAQSATTYGKSITVVQLQGDHKCVCKLVCASCNVCVHAYTCTCIDYAMIGKANELLSIANSNYNADLLHTAAQHITSYWHYKSLSISSYFT